MVNKKVQNVLKVSAVLVMFMLLVFSFPACSQTYSKDSISSNLKGAGYTVSEGQEIRFDDGTSTTSMAGIQAVFLVTKGFGADKEVGYMLVFNSIENADKVSDGHLAELFTSAKSACGSNKESSVDMGRWNNVVFAGCKTIRQTAQIQ